MCVLRAYGDNFDVDAFLSSSTLPVCAVKRKGEPVAPASNPSGRRHEWSGIHLSVSDAEFDDFARQLEDATNFLNSNQEQLQRLSSFPGVESLVLDFGIDRRATWLQCYSLSEDLVRLAGGLRLEIMMSIYDRNSGL